jgi:hypothetical protein
MKRWLIFPLFLCLFACKGKNEDIFFTPSKASVYFAEIEKVCSRDSGKLWGTNLYGPIIFIDRTSRKMIANKADNEGLLKSKDGVYTGVFPKELLISQAPVKFGGSEYAMAPLPPEEDDYRIKTRAIHGLFHRFQESRGIMPGLFNTSNMDEKEARLWIKLEWKALRKALTTDGDEKLLAIRDALIFRGANREQYHKFAADENKFETYEGLATFTYTILCTTSPQEFKSRLLENLDRVYGMQSFSRSYGFIHGALYATLLYEAGFDLKSITTEDYDLGNQVKEVYKINLPSICRDVAGSLAVNYDIAVINKEEETRDADIEASTNKQISAFTDRPVVFFELESPYFDFEPEDVHSLGDAGILYNTIRVSDNWGKLTVEKGGCLVSNNLKYLRVTARGCKAEKAHVSGEGWHLILNDGWQLVQVEQNFFIRKLMP